MEIDEVVVSHVKTMLESLKPSDFKLSINWFKDIEKTENQKLPEKKFHVVLQKSPSVNYGGVVTQGLTMSILCDSKYLSEAFTLLENYQYQTLNHKYFIGSYTVSEKFNTPYIAQNFIAVNLGYSSQVELVGTIVVSTGLNDIIKLKIENEEIPFIMVSETLATTPLSQATIQKDGTFPKLAKTINQVGNYTLSLKLLKTNAQVFNMIDKMISGEASINYPFKITLQRTNKTVNRVMVLTSSNITSQCGDLPIMSIVFADARMEEIS